MARIPSRNSILVVALSIVGLSSSIPAHGASPREALLGTWRGTSTCVAKETHPACKDEVVIYRFSPSPTKEAGVVLAPDKIVDGKPEPMGDLEFTYDTKLGAWLAEFSNARVHVLWTFRADGNDLKGTLVELPSRALGREVSATKDSR